MSHIDIKSLIPELKCFENKLIEAYAFIQTMDEGEKAYVKKLARASMIGASTRIENAQLTDSEVNWLDTVLQTDGRPTAFEANRDLIENKLSKERERSYEEVVGCRSMLQAIIEDGSSLKPLRESDVRYLHTLLLKPYGKASHYTGQYKTQPNYGSRVAKVQITT